MKYQFRASSVFEKNIKKMKKKYPHIKEDVKKVICDLDENIEIGDRIQGLEKKIYKIRVNSTDMKKGKSGSFRMIYYLVNAKNEVILLTIYAKAKQENISAEQIKDIMKRL